MATEQQGREIFPHPDAFDRNEAQVALDPPTADNTYGSLGPTKSMLDMRYPTGVYALNEQMNAAESLRIHRMNHCVEILQEALTIRANGPLMSEIRLFLRERKDEITTLLDGIV